MLKYIADLSESNNGIGGVVVTGQPGIGKTMFLYYILIHRILHGQPTAFQPTSSHTLIFHHSRAEIFGEHTTIDSLAYPGAWALSDSNADVYQPRREFVELHNRFFLVQATSSQPSRWKAWSQQRRAKLAVMDFWTWSEIYIGATEFESHLKNINKETLMDLFNKQGNRNRNRNWYFRKRSRSVSW